MLKDIDFKKTEDIAIAIVPEGTEGETMWIAYFLNMGNNTLETVIVNSKGYGELEGKAVQTSTLRWLLGDLEPQSASKIEEMPQDVSRLTNEFWVSYYIGDQIYDKKYIFVLDSLRTEHLVNLPLLETKGVLIK
jgi:hypothetical protein